MNMNRHFGVNFLNCNFPGSEAETVEFPSGTKYTGAMKNNKFDGYGTYYNKEGGVVYQGSWSQGQKKGMGVSAGRTGPSILESGGGMCGMGGGGWCITRVMCMLESGGMA